MKNNTTRNYLIAGVFIILIIGLILWGKSTSKTTIPITEEHPETLSGIQTTPAPWKAETQYLGARLKAIGLPALAEEGFAVHIHQHLDIFIEGKAIPVPAGIGISEQERFISALHTHELDSIIHVESPKIQTFTIGQFFDIWGVRFTKDSIGGYVATGDKKLRVFVGGVEYTGDPRGLVLESHQEIVVAYGTDQELPNPIPKDFDFPAGD
jgi:hypothetical protein